MGWPALDFVNINVDAASDICYAVGGPLEEMTNAMHVEATTLLNAV
jgi:hypothetical protein